MRIPDPKANTTTEAYLAYKAGYLEESELKPVLYEPYLHFDAWLAYWAGLTTDYPHGIGKNLCNLGTKTVAGYELFELAEPLEIGTYTFSAQVTSDDTGSTKCFVRLMNGSTIGVGAARIDRSSGRTSITITTNGIADHIYLYAGYDASGSSGDTATFTDIQIEKGSTATDYEPYTKIPEMLTDEEALVAYLSGVTDTYPEEIKDPYDVRIVGYLKHLASIRWPEPDYPVNNEEFYLSTMEPTHTSNPVPSSDIELNTAEGKIISVEAYGDTYQQTYSGKNNINGAYSEIKQTVRCTAEASGNGFNITSTASSGATYVMIPIPNITGLLGKTVTVSYVATGSGIKARFYYYNSSWSATTAIGSSETVTLPNSIEGYAGIGVVFYTSNDSSATYNDIQLEEGSSATSYEPYTGGIPAPNPDYPQDIQVVTGEQTVEVCGKNLIGYESPNLDAYFEGSGSQITASSNNRLYYIKCKYNATYSITTPATGTGTVFGGGCRVGVTNELPAIGVTVPTVVKYGTSMAQPSTYTTTAENAYFVVRIQAQTGSGLNLDQTAKAFFDACQIEIGSTATDYEPYQSQSYSISLGSIELCKIGNYEDYIYKSGDDWYIHKNIGKMVLNGSESWKYLPQSSSPFYYQGSKNIGQQTTNGRLVVSDYFLPTNTWSEKKVGIWVDTNIIVKTKDSLDGSGNANSFISWLNTHNVSVYCVLANPTETKITDATLVEQLEALLEADTYNGKTCIKVTTTDPNLPALLKVEAYKY